MGQGWSDGSFPVADGQLPSQVISQARHRSDSEPPTSWGGHAVTRIPENEEVNVQTSDIQYADWKKSSLASGILREKSGMAPPPTTPSKSAPTTPLSEEPSPLTPTAAAATPDQAAAQQQQPNKPKLGRSMSVDYAHLADFSMFPDKFSLAPPPSTGPPHNNLQQLQQPHPPRSRHSSSHSAADDQLIPTPTTPLSNITSSFFRSRASSDSKAMEERYQNEPSSVTTKDMSKPPTKAIDNSSEGDHGGLQVPAAAAGAGAGGQFRPRSSSYSGRFPFFDFSMIPDKDPHFNSGGGETGADTTTTTSRRVRRSSSTTSGSSGGSSHDLQPPTVNVVDGSSVVAAALTMAASSPPDPPQAKVETTSKPPPPPPAKAQNAPRFTFFDYSLIPDKDPRAFVRTRERKDN